MFAHTVDVKGPGEDQYAVDRLVEDLKWLGFSRVSLRSDNEPAILKLLEVTLKNLRVDVLHDEPGVAGAMGVPPDEEPSETPEASGEAQAGSGGPPRPPRAASGPEQVVQEHPAAYDSAGNGEVENAIRRFSGLLRTLKLCLEQRIQRRVPGEHKLMSWLVEFTAWLLTVRVQGIDGITAYHRVRGRGYAKRGVGFGELVQFKLPSKGPLRKQDGSLDRRWLHGIVLGYSRISHEYWIYCEDRAILARSIQRLPLNVRWDRDRLEGVSLSRHDLHKPRPAGRRLVPDGSIQEHAAGRAAHFKGMPLKKSDFMAHGYTDDCARCQHAERHGWGQSTLPHSRRCRDRLMTEIEKTIDGKRRVEMHEQRAERYVATEKVPPEQVVGGMSLRCLTTSSRAPPKISSSSTSTRSMARRRL